MAPFLSTTLSCYRVEFLLVSIPFYLQLFFTPIFLLNAARSDICSYFVLLILFPDELKPVPDDGHEYRPA
jgi:hypothetical protein